MRMMCTWNKAVMTVAAALVVIVAAARLGVIVRMMRILM
jgi:hypothetical protein